MLNTLLLEKDKSQFDKGIASSSIVMWGVVAHW